MSLLDRGTSEQIPLGVEQIVVIGPDGKDVTVTAKEGDFSFTPDVSGVHVVTVKYLNTVRDVHSLYIRK